MILGLKLNNRKIFIVFILVCLVFFVGIYMYINKSKSQVVFPNEAKWIDSLVLTFNDKEYKVTNKKTSNIDKIIGGITYHGNVGVSYKLYSIRDIKDYNKIAIKTRDGYLIATKK